MPRSAFGMPLFKKTVWGFVRKPARIRPNWGRLDRIGWSWIVEKTGFFCFSRGVAWEGGSDRSRAEVAAPQRFLASYGSAVRGFVRDFVRRRIHGG